MNETALTAKGNKAISQVSFDDVVITREDVKAYLCPEATDKEIFMAMGIMASYKLNPFKREVHLIKYKGSPAEVIVGYETYLKRAERTGKLNGWKAWIDKKEGRAYVEINRKDWEKPFQWYIELGEFDKKRATWTQIPDFMGKKVVIAQGFRLAFPDEIGGMPYTAEERQVYDIVDAPAEEKPMPKAKSETAKPPEPAKPPETKPAETKPATEEEIPFAPETPERTELTVTEALQKESGSVFEVVGVFKGRTERKPKNKTVYDYTIADDQNEMIISCWDKLNFEAVDILKAEAVGIFVGNNGVKHYSSRKLSKYE
jgi:phage recombination protein Bet